MNEEIEVKQSDNDRISTFAKNSSLLVQRGALATLTAGGGWALWNGLVPKFEIREAIFGASLLMVGVVAEFFIWLKQRGDVKARHKAKAEAIADEKEELEKIKPPGTP